MAFTGKAGSGKTTAVQALKDIGIGTVYNVKFAQPLYDMQEFLYNRIKTVYTRPPDFKKDRRLLQFIGTEWGRQTVNENIWVDIWVKRIEQVRGMDSDVILTADDTRFDNEALAANKLSGIVIKIDRDAAASDAGSHISEAGINNSLIQYTVKNNGTYEEFKEALAALFNQITAERVA